MKWASLGIVLCLTVASLPAPARADEASLLAKEHFRRGTRAYDLGHFLEAASEYEKAYEAKENPALLYNLGQAYRGAGEHQKALNAYRAYLRNAPDAPNRDEVAHFIDALKKAIEAEKSAAERPPTGTIPEPNTHPGQTGTTGTTGTTTTTTATVEPPPPPLPPRREPDRHELAVGRKLRLAGFATGGLGVAAVIVAGAFAGLTANINSELNHPAKTTPPPSYNHSLESKGRTYQGVETALFAVGGAAVVAGVTTLVIGTRKVKRNSFALAPAAAPGQVGVTFGMGF